ncbi:MAG: tRNA (adenosine(37)-N6)-dimethylallyltransferase MiaA [Actinobacteria bacterium]|nr:tRNA (adenosine(37)-N6)-dimethylallyltransferase MiaA [Actinomycetota bacterium]MBU1942885.1 tRNA (adenosine(37)-N6)-dimethylallyltransferase MiaA [Actinomycetota bacterium]MBU2687617.1 tRNA (adenosine(37)-N6)-dimethylallyltransferase MiaA [Actinomycetota bacterium]
MPESGTRPAPGTTLLALVGPTGVGKTAAALRIAPVLGAEIVSVDSMQVYRGMDTGTAKPSADDRASVPFHLLDVADPTDNFSAAAFKSLADSAILGICSRGRLPLLVGGSGLYFRAVVDDLEFGAGSSFEDEGPLRELSDAEAHSLLASVDPHAAGRIPPANRHRVVRALQAASAGRAVPHGRRAWTDYESPYRLVVAGLNMERSALYRVIERRVDEMLASGLEDEARRLKEEGLAVGTTAGEALGYRQLLEYLEGTTSRDEAVERIKRRTCNYAKRQLTWFRADPRIRWFEVETAGRDSAEVERAVRDAAGLVLEYMRDNMEN